MRQLAEQVLIERFARQVVTGHTEKGRVQYVLVGEPGPAEKTWFSLQAQHGARR